MSLKLYAHPFSSYCQKAIVALYENATPFELKMLNFGDAEVMKEFAALWPIEKMPILVDGSRSIMETSIIIEYLALHYPGQIRLLPEDPKDAIDVRFMDRFFDNYVMTPMQRIVGDSLRSPEQRDAQTVTEARALLDKAYRWLDNRLDERRTGCEWASGEGFSLADCAAAPSLFYADWVHAIADEFLHVRAYRNRLLARPSFARAVDEAREYRSFFPLGAPDRD